MKLAGVAVFAVLVAACGPDPSPHAQCAAPGIAVNVESLPARWVARGQFTLCQEKVCATQTSPFTGYYGRGPFLTRRSEDTTPVVVTLRVEVDGVRVVNARTQGSVQPSARVRGEISETCGGTIRLRLDRQHTTLETQPSS